MAAHPGQGENNGGKGPFSDKQLADRQFSYALSEAILAGDVTDRKPLLRGAEKVADRQEQDGSWKLDANQAIGSPATYGRVLGTVIARQVLLRADGRHFQQPIQNAERFLKKQRPKTVLDAAAVLLFANSLDGQAASELQEYCLQVIRKGEDPDGGWGPYVNSVAEPFDTDIVLLALSQFPEETRAAKLIRRGRDFLIKEQLADGSWLETTRPETPKVMPSDFQQRAGH